MKVNLRTTLRPILAALLLGCALGSFGPSTEIVRGQTTHRIVVHGLRQELNLREGKNKIVVVRGGTRSNTIKVKIQ